MKSQIQSLVAQGRSKDATVKSNIETANEYLSTGNFEAVRVVKTKGYLKNLNINF